MKNHLPIAAFLLLLIPSSARAQTSLRWERHVGQTSVWPGDRFHYQITLSVPTGVKVALEDLDETNVNFEPFVLMTTQVESVETDNGVRHRFDYLLANYEIGDKRVEIPPLAIRYEEGISREANTPSTMELRIPSFPISIRTTLNRSARESWIRESLVSSASTGRRWGVVLLGLAGLIVSSLPLGLWVWRQMPNWRARRRQLSRKKFLQELSKSVNRIERLSKESSLEIKDQYRSLEGVVQEYIQYFWGFKAGALTHSELASRLNHSDTSPVQGEILVGIVEHGQECRYSPSEKASWRDAFLKDLQQLRKLCL